MASRTYGYARVSARDQNLDRQMDALAAFGVSGERVFADRASGRDFERPEYQRLLGALRRGDVVVVKSIDRFGRNYEEILEEWRRITRGAGCSIVVLDMPLLDTREDRGVTGRLISDIVLQLLSYVAEKERDFIRQRQAEGIAAAQERGVRFGRPPKKRPRSYAATKRAYLSGTITKKEAAGRLRVSPTTFEKWLAQDGDGR
ncbi:recombinase family protein [Paratractidigestivibacter faecalis]|uniref:recombinase family protein n=1 Tax=Paratractidigestivibacter faecalis TaxID=2292441 RepID=UPI003F972E1D